MDMIPRVFEARQVVDALTLLIDGATNYAIYMLDPEGRVAIWNRGAERIKGWTEREIVGQSAVRFYPAVDIAAGKPAEDLARATRFGRVEEESWRIRKDGSRFLANVTITALYDSSGKLRGFGKVVRDITEQRTAQAALALRESQLAAILATVPDAMVLFDATLHIVTFSRTAERLFGWPEAEMIGQPVEILLATTDHADIFNSATLPLSGRQLVGRRRDGSTFPFELALDRMVSGGASSFIAFMRDLSERERTLGELDRLQGKLAQVARVSLLGVMGTTLAHELNQPITAVVNYAETARDLMDRDAPRASIVEALNGVVGEALRSGEIVRQLRSFIARGELDKQHCDLSALIRESCDILAGMLTEHAIVLRLDLDHGDREVFVERIQVQQVVINLVRNAIEAMAAATPRLLTIVTRRERATVRVSVCDTGSGITDLMAPTLFEAFTSDKAGGMGVGLSICQTIVEAHGGRIRAATREGTTCFSFTLPDHGPVS